MLKFIETTGRTEEDAISAALFQLGLERDDVSVEVVERAKTGFFGFGSNPAKVRVSYEEENGVAKPLGSNDFKIDVFGEPDPVVEEKKPEPVKPVTEKVQAEPVVEVKEEPTPVAEAEEESGEMETILAAKPGWKPARTNNKRERQPRRQPRREEQIQPGDEIVMQAAPHVEKPVELTPAAADDEKAQQIGRFLTGLMEHLNVEATPEIFATSEGGYKVILQGENLGAIIGRRGETLDAVQQLTNYSVNRGQSKRVRIHVDAEGYRAKREESLQRLAVKVAGKVVKYRKNMTLEPMNAYERHVIHTALQDYPNVSTFSTGVEPNRRTVVAYAPGQK